MAEVAAIPNVLYSPGYQSRVGITIVFCGLVLESTATPASATRDLKPS